MTQVPSSPALKDRGLSTQARLGGALLIPLGLVMGYFFLWQPLQHARAGEPFTYSMREVLLAPAVVYGGIAVLVLDLRDGQVYQLKPNGKRTFTRKGWIFVTGLVVVLALTLILWNRALHALGYSGM